MRNHLLAAALLGAGMLAGCGDPPEATVGRDAGQPGASARDAGAVAAPGAVGWDPLLPGVGDVVTFWAGKPGALHWGVDGWKAPAQALWPAGTQTFDEKAVETPLAGPDGQGRWTVAIGPLPDGIASIDFVLRHSDGTWDNNGGGDFHVAVSASPAPRADAGAVTIASPPDAGPVSGPPDAASAAAVDAGGTTTTVPGNPDSVGLGARKTIATDGKNTGGEWGDDTLLIRDPAADDARFLGSNWCAHEPPWDYAALHAAWDDQYLYVGIQFVNVTDVLDPANLGSSDATIHSMDLVQFLAFDVVDGAGYGAGGDMWKKDQAFGGPNLPDFQLYFHSNFSQQGTYFGGWDGAKLAQTTDGLKTKDLAGAGGRFLVGQSLPGVDPHADDSSPGDYGASSVDYVKDRGHDGSHDTFFELKIPLSLLGIDADRLDHGAIGLFAANGDGSAVDSIPNDPATSSTPGVSASNSPMEWDVAADDDVYTAPFALVGHPAP